MIKYERNIIMFKKVIAACLLLCVILSMCACSKQINSTEQQGTEQSEIQRLESIEELTLTVNGITIKGGMTLKECLDAGLFLYSPEADYEMSPKYLIGAMVKISESDDYSFIIKLDSQKSEKSNIMDAIVVGFQVVYKEKPSHININVCGLNEKSKISDFEKLLGPKDEVMTTLGKGHMWYDTELTNSDYLLYGCITEFAGEDELNAIVIEANSTLLNNNN
jgi:hypothetical protein